MKFSWRNENFNNGFTFLGLAVPLDEPLIKEAKGMSYEIWEYDDIKSQLLIIPYLRHGQKNKKMLARLRRWVPLNEYLDAANKVTPKEIFISSALKYQRLASFFLGKHPLLAQKHYLVCQHICSAKTKGGNND
ncbi:hypothetical protein [Nitrospira sp. BLG_2]|uniref:hypothetical protein n=1 Tax=Nitrospira sp. BLG_2 TaxID=3397507 RepID=UPI003B9BEA2C